MRYIASFLYVCAFSVCGCLFFIPSGAQAEQFPVHDTMRPNVEFWTNIYAKYPSSKGVIHDSHNLGVVYEVVNLKPLGYGSRKANKRKIKTVKEKYKKVLKTLAQGNSPKSKLERKVYNLFGQHPTRQQFKEARGHIRFQLGQKDRYLAGLVRSGQYLARIKAIFRSEGLPEDLAYLPHVESSFNYKAYSKFGAAGIWQFTRGTGRRYMTVDYVVDERRDPIVASRAAARYLKSNHRQLGSWPFALTAYNHGEHGMARAKEKHGNYKNVFDKYDGRRFGFASRNFYSSFIAARTVAKQYQKYFGPVVFDKPVLYHTVEMPGFASVASVAKFFRVSPKDLQHVNPALRPPVFKGQKHIPKDYILRLPGKARRMARMANAMPSSIFHAKQKRSKFYRVQRGDTAGKIARQHRVSVSDLVIANGLSRRATIYVGQNLRIPGLGEKPVLLARNSQKQKQKKKPVAVAKIQKEKRKPRLLALKDGQKWKPSKGPFGLVAAKEGQPAKSVLVAKVESPKPPQIQQPEPAVVVPVKKVVVKPVEMASKRVRVNPVAVILVPDLPGTEVLAEVKNDSEPVNPYVLTGNFFVIQLKQVQGLNTGQIQVETDETLGHYADWLDIPTKRIRHLNKFRYGRPIHYGQKLRIPFGKVSQEEFEERRYLYHKELVEDFYQAFTVAGEKTYEIRKGDTLWKLCHERFDMPFWLLKQYNPDFNFKSIHPGNQIKVPVVQSPENADTEFVAGVTVPKTQQPILLAVQK